MDTMTVLEHLRFYARLRGVTNVEYNVQEVIRAVGLLPFSNRMASKLSGGSKRKLSLGIALMGMLHLNNIYASLLTSTRQSISPPS
jgi:ABC-type multidrug transport system ATPase subunit